MNPLLVIVWRSKNSYLQCVNTISQTYLSQNFQEMVQSHLPPSQAPPSFSSLTVQKLPVTKSWEWGYNHRSRPFQQLNALGVDCSCFVQLSRRWKSMNLCKYNYIFGYMGTLSTSFHACRWIPTDIFLSGLLSPVGCLHYFYPDLFLHW